MKKILLILLVFGSVNFDVDWFDYFKADYFISETGNDNNSGTAPWDAWQTLTKVNSEQSTMPDNSRIAFNRDDKWTGTITVGKSNLQFKDYGRGADKPKIYGSRIVTESWTVHSGNIYKATIDETDIKQLFVDGARMKLARYPDTGYFAITSVTSATVFGSDDVNPALDYSGAKIAIRTDAYTFRIGDVTSNADTTITLTAGLTNGAASTTRKIGDGFWLIDKLIFLTSAGEWYYDNAANTLYVWMPDSGSPTGHEVRISTFDDCFNLTSKDYISIKNLDIKHAGLYGVNMTTSNYLTVDNCTFDDNNVAAIYNPALSSTNLTASNNTISGSVSGIRALGHSSTITGNSVSEIGQLENVSKDLTTYLSNFGTAIMSRGNNDIIHSNVLSDIGYNGINFQGLNTSVKYNYILNTCNVLDDGGAIYAVSVTPASYPDNTKTIGSVIDSNVVVDCYGNIEGNVATATTSTGIYLDNGTKGVRVQNNVVSGNATGLYLKGGFDTIQNNIFYNSMMFVRIQDQFDETLVENNGFYQSARLGYYTWWPTALQDARLIRYGNADTASYFNNNTYITRYSSDALFYPTTSKTFAQWQSMGQDVLSTLTTTAHTTGYKERLLYNETASNKTFYANSAGITNVTDAFTGDAVTFPLTLTPYSGKMVEAVGGDFIVDYIDVTAPVITAFTMTDSIAEFTVTPLTLTSTGSTISYLITETNTTPSLSAVGWSLTPSYTFTSGGNKTLYAWARDAAGNISASATDSTVITMELIGFPTVYGSTSSTTVRRGMPVTMTETGTIQSISFYHDGGTGTALVGVYADNGTAPSTRLAISAETALLTSAGWNTVNLITPVEVASGTKVWIAFTTSIGGSHFEAGTPYRAQATSGDYSNGLPDPFGTSNQSTNRVSVYCTYIK